jgi:poly(A) polymerase
MIKLPEAEWQQREGMRKLLATLSAADGETRYVGGSVRDALLGLPATDVDLATRLQPDEVIERLKKAHIKAVPTGIAHGTVTAVLREGPVEVTTLRRDVATDGRRATIAYTHDWREDAARRDFTINAFSADPLTLELFDYFGGQEDLKARRVRFIGDPLTRIAEDHLRILRFFRFHARFGGPDPHAPSLDACAARANDLMALSRERIADEWLKLLGLVSPTAAVALMLERGILRPVMPEVEAARADDLATLVEREQALAVAPEPLRRFAALLPPDAEVATSLGLRLRLSNKAVKRLAKAAERNGEGADARALAYRIGADEAVDRILLGTAPIDEAREQLASIREWDKPRLPLTGGDIIAMGVRAGPLVAKTLQAVERDWIDAGFPKDTDEVRALARARVDQALRDSQ